MSRIELEVPAKSLRLFAKTLSCMSKIGNEVFLEGREERLVLRALSASRSAFAGITLHRAFFDHYSLSTTAVAAVGGTASSSGSSSSACRCQVKLKALCAVFRSAALAQVERCVVVADTLQARLYVDLHCHRGVVKQYRIPFDDESEALEARYDTTGASRIVVRPRVLLDALANFRQTSADELTLILPPRTAPATARILLRSTPVPPADPMQAPVVTECALDPHSLDEYSVEPAPNITASGGGGAGVYEGGTSLTFSLKDFKHVCSLCEVVALPMTLQVTRSGQPLVCSTRFFNTFEAVFVQATLLEHPQQQPTPSSTQGSASKQPAMMPKHEAKQSPSTPGVAAAAAAASAVLLLLALFLLPLMFARTHHSNDNALQTSLSLNHHHTHNNRQRRARRRGPSTNRASPHFSTNGSSASNTNGSCNNRGKKKGSAILSGCVFFFPNRLRALAPLPQRTHNE